MSADFRFNISEPLKSGIDFYGLPIPQGSIVVDIQSSLIASAQKISYASADIQAGTVVVSVSQEIQKALIDIQITSDLTASAMEIQFISTNITGDVSSEIAGKKIAFANVDVSINSNAQIQAIKESFASSIITSQSSTSFTAIEILNALININTFTVVVSVGKEFSYAKANISAPSTSVIATGIKFAVNDVPDTSNYRVLFILDDKPLTNQGRELTNDQSMVFIENKNWNNLKSRYYKRSSTAGRNSFTISWKFLPNSKYDTIDRRYARDYIKQLASDPDVHTFKIINNDFNQATPYTETQYSVFIKDYSETLVRRDLQNDVYYWDCNLTLEEV